MMNDSTMSKAKRDSKKGQQKETTPTYQIAVGLLCWQREGDCSMQLVAHIWLQRGVVALQLERRVHRQLWKG